MPHGTTTGRSSRLRQVNLDWLPATYYALCVDSCRFWSGSWYLSILPDAPSMNLHRCMMITVSLPIRDSVAGNEKSPAIKPDLGPLIACVDLGHKPIF